MNINIEGMTEYELLKLAKIGAEAEIKDTCQLIADNSISSGRIADLRELIQKYDVVYAALTELRHRKEAEEDAGN